MWAHGNDPHAEIDEDCIAGTVLEPGFDTVGANPDQVLSIVFQLSRRVLIGIDHPHKPVAIVEVVS